MKNIVCILLLAVFISCYSKENNTGNTSLKTANKELYDKTDFYYKLSESAIELTHQKVYYDPMYYVIPYPDGDVPADRGVCCDVVIRAYRKLGIDLQKEVHEDMSANFSAYPHSWGLKQTDKNIDHRRVPNLMKFFERHNAGLTITNNSKDYKYGDVVCWDLGRGITHIGMVVTTKSEDGERYLIVHNIGSGQVLSDCLFRFKIIGHYRYKKGGNRTNQNIL